VLAADAPKRMRYWFGRGLTGMRLFTIGSTMKTQADWIDDPRVYPAWETAGDLGTPICMQMSKQAFPQLVNLVKRFPNVKVILDHLSRPVLEDGPPYAAAASLFELARFPTIYLKVTPRTFTECRHGKATPETFFPKLVGEFGASRIAWGSNYPASAGPLKDLLMVARAAVAGLPLSDQNWIFAKTAQSLYPALCDK